MVNWWFGVFGGLDCFLDPFFERDCYLRLPRFESQSPGNHRSFQKLQGGIADIGYAPNGSPFCWPPKNTFFWNGGKIARLPFGVLRNA